LTKVQATVTAGQTLHIKMAIADIDDDGIADGNDNCLHPFNSLQKDFDNDGVGYTCDLTPAPSQMEFVKMTGGGAMAGKAKSDSNFGFNVQTSQPA